ncbi:Phosphoribosyltransferase [Burkholderiales bacterium]|nr:Phosphoribosyltransferase [Burkholderiales bacterium]
MVLFSDRTEAGRALASQLAKLDLPAPLVLALPRGGVPVAVAVARELNAPLDLLLVRKIGVPWQPELAVAAIVDGQQPELVVDEETRQAAGVDQAYIDAEAKVQLQEIERRRRAYLGERLPLSVQGRTAIVVDDGIATGTSMRAALQALRRRNPAAIVLAVPVAPRETIQALRRQVDQVVCLAQPEPFYAVGMHYRDFHQIEDAEVIAALSAMSKTP